MEKQEIIDLITNTLVKDPQIRTFGGDAKSTWGNPLTEALNGIQPIFAAGVDVKLVVTMVIESLETIIKVQSGKDAING